MRAANSTKSRRATQRSPRFDHLEDRRLLALSWTSTSLSLFFHDVGATVTPNGDFFVNDTFKSTDPWIRGRHGRRWPPLPTSPAGPSPTPRPIRPS